LLAFKSRWRADHAMRVLLWAAACQALLSFF
jgi:hypothetical protein